MYSMRYMHRYDKDTTACRSKKQNYDGGTPADFLTVSQGGLIISKPGFSFS